MSPWTKAKVFGMHAIAKLQGWKVTNEDIAKVVKKVGGGSPSDQAIRDLRTTFDSDPHWHPGKAEEVAQKPGPKPKFTEQNARVRTRVGSVASKQEEGRKSTCT